MIPFEKWEGLGNDFVLVDASQPLGLETVRTMCDRRLGVGADGVISVDAGDVPRMIVFNADGSRPEMCGNGLRCVASRLYEGAGATHFVVQTDAGPRACVVAPGAAGSFVVTVEMGVAELGEYLHFPEVFDGGPFARISMGNPHAIVFAQPERTSMDTIGPRVERAVEGGTNVEFVRVEDDALDVIVWERGVGYTEACGTGACAALVAACLQERAPFDRFVKVTLPGGPLEVRVAKDTLAVTMRGPARRVFRGVWGS